MQGKVPIERKTTTNETMVLKQNKTPDRNKSRADKQFNLEQKDYLLSASTGRKGTLIGHINMHLYA